MRPEASFLCLALLWMTLTHAGASAAAAAERGSSGGMTSVSVAAPSGRPGPRRVAAMRPSGLNQGLPWRSRAFFADRGRKRGFRKPSGFDAAGLIGFPFGVGLDGLGTFPEPLPADAPPPKQDLPTTIGIPASPVEPPAIYVIGGRTGSSRAAAGSASVRTGQPAPVVRETANTGRSEQVASGPLILRVPSGR